MWTLTHCFVLCKVEFQRFDVILKTERFERLKDIIAVDSLLVFLFTYVTSPGVGEEDTK